MSLSIPQLNPAAIEAKNRVLPLLGRVLVQRLLRPSKTKVGVILPEDDKDKLSEGLVLSVGKGDRNPNDPEKTISMPLKPGDHVLLPSYPSNIIRVMGEEFQIYNADEILAKIMPMTK